jgi:hypothetical protein
MATALKQRKSKDVETNKAEEIRKAAKEIGGRKIRPKDVVALLASRDIAVAPAQVSATLKAAGYRPLRRRKTASPAKANHILSNNGVSVEHLIAAKALAKQVGGLDVARNALNVLARLS